MEDKQNIRPDSDHVPNAVRSELDIRWGTNYVNYTGESGWQHTVYEWKPEEDITPYELALCVPMFFSAASGLNENYDKLPEQAKRHWVRKAAGES
jgi:hypothetical protein